jgi:hypothetical protein
MTGLHVDEMPLEVGLLKNVFCLRARTKIHIQNVSYKHRHNSQSM